MKKTPPYEDHRDPRNPPTNAKQRELDRAAAKTEGAGGTRDDKGGSNGDDDRA